MTDETMQESLNELKYHIVGQRVIKVTHEGETTSLFLSNGKTVRLKDTDDCCAHTEMINVIRKLDTIDHVITDVTETDEYSSWHIVAGMEEVFEFDVSWSEGSGYYMYGFLIDVVNHH